jgi:hypothetical protein
MNKQITHAQFERTVNMFKGFAKEDIRVEFFVGAFWVFGSELAMYRIARQYGRCDVEYSEPLSSFYFKLEMPGTVGEMATD